MEGQANESEQVTIMVFEDGTSPNNYLGKISSQNIKETVVQGGHLSFDTTVYDAINTVSFIDDFDADEKGNFAHNVKLKGTGIYDVYLLYSDSGELKVIENINFTSSTDYNSLIDELNSSDKNTFIEKILNPENKVLLGFNDEQGYTANAETVAEIMYASRENGKLKYDYNENKSLYRASVATDVLNNGNSVDISYLDYVLSRNASLADFVEKYADDETEIMAHLKNKEIKDTNGLTKELKKAALLMIVENPDGYENIKKAFENFKDITEISSPTSKNKVYSKLAGKKFNKISELVSAYKSALSEEPADGGSSGGGGGGGGSSEKVPGKSDLHTVQPSTSENEVTETINRNIFNDLDSVTWAQEAIVNLAVKGVVNGKSDYIFAPNDCITREEFTKLVVAALANYETPANISFADVDSSSWAYTYIAKAKNAGIVNGYSDALFGAKDLITRQDMSVIIYNAAKYKEIKLENAHNALTFADDDKISDYAKEAVYTLRNMEIVNGTDETHFEPKSYATRAQAAVMLYRLLLK